MDYENDMKRFSDHMNALAYAKEIVNLIRGRHFKL